MSQPQKGICAEPNLHAQYLLFNVVDEDSQAVRAKLGRVLEVLDHYDNEHYEAMVSGVIAVGNNYWSELFPGPIPVELTPFPDMQCEDRVAPSTPTDLFIQIRADRWDICYAIGLEVMELLRIHVELVEHVQGFRYLDGRDLNGYLYAPDNPRGMQRMNVAVLGADEEFVGGSYVHVQRFRHDLRRWQSLSQRQQEQVMGTTKEHNLASVECNPSSHSVRANLTSHENGVPELLKQGMPYGDMLVQGMFSVTCSSSSKPFKRMLDSQIFGTGDGDYDRWLDFTSAESGGAYFAPSINFIKQQAKLQYWQLNPQARMTPVNFNQLYYFHMVAEHGSIARVSELLHITPQTISGQISALEDTIGAPLFTRQSRRLVPTELGHLVQRYATDIFQLGDELKAVLTQQHSQWQSFTVGITDVLPKTLVYEMLKPVLELPVKLVCREGELTSLLGELAVNKLDMVLADQPIQTGSHVKAYSHLVTESSMAVFATEQLAIELTNGFPESLTGKRFLLQGKKSLIRQKLLGWFSEMDIQPDIHAEFDDSALMLAFAQQGLGAFAAPELLSEHLKTQYNLIKVGTINRVTEQLYAISPERKLSHPAVVTLVKALRK